MKRVSKKGFTLLELMLAIAIALVISGLFISLIVAIRTSFYRAYNDDDCTDIAAMYARALENQILYDVQNGVTDTITIDSDGVLTSTANNFGFADRIVNFNNSSSEQKWDIRMLAYYNEQTGEFIYKFYFIDLYVNPGYCHYVYEGSFWIPEYPGFINNADYTVNGGATTKEDYFSITIAPAGVPDPAVPGSILPTNTESFYSLIIYDEYGNRDINDASTEINVPVASSSIIVKPV